MERIDSPAPGAGAHQIALKRSQFRHRERQATEDANVLGVLAGKIDINTSSIPAIEATHKSNANQIFRPDFGFRSLTTMLTSDLLETYTKCSPTYQVAINPRRALTKPSKGVLNDGFDNENSDFILYVNDIVGAQEGHQYCIIDLLGQGTFGQVVKCRNTKTNALAAIKFIKNKPAYYNQALVEVAILETVTL